MRPQWNRVNNNNNEEEKRAEEPNNGGDQRFDNSYVRQKSMVNETPANMPEEQKKEIEDCVQEQEKFI